jgi:hypothetical protein
MSLISPRILCPFARQHEGETTLNSSMIIAWLKQQQKDKKLFFIVIKWDLYIPSAREFFQHKSTPLLGITMGYIHKINSWGCTFSKDFNDCLL